MPVPAVSSFQLDLHLYLVFFPPGLLVIEKLILLRTTLRMGLGNPINP